MQSSSRGGVAVTPEPSIDIREVWKGHPGEMAKAMLAGAGFSFRFDGESVGSAFASDWKIDFVAEEGSRTTTLVARHASGLAVRRETRVLTEFAAVEYRLIFQNTSNTSLPLLSEVRSLEIALGEAMLDGNCVVSSGGGLADAVLPPRSFALRRSAFSSMLEHAAVIEMTTAGGRSSNKDLPFFLIHNEAKREGMIVAFGWSGQWVTAVFCDPVTRTFSLKGKIPDLKIALEAGEEIQCPTVLVGLYQGDVAEGSNRLRRIIREVYTPKLAGESYLPAATYDTWWNIGVDFDEALLRRLADGAASIDQEYFLLDAGWFAGTGKGHDFSSGVGNWYDIDESKLPRGLKPVADHVRSTGLQFGLWFEPERVAENSRLAREHPEWILWGPGTDAPESWWRDLFPDFFRRRYGLLDYGRADVQQWVKELLDRYIRDYGVKYIRYDFNLDPLPCWNANDAADRRGITQLRHVNGLYTIIDWIRAHHPGAVLEGCASGGRRIDLEMARRFHTFWISDYSIDPAIVRFHLFGINHFLPGNYNFAACTVPSPHRQDFQPDDLAFQSLFGGAMGTSGRVDSWTAQMQEKARLHVQTWKKLRRYLVEDYYPLSDQPGDLKSWSGWQFHDPGDQSGFIQTFRATTRAAQHRFFPRGLDGSARFRFTDAYTGETFSISGTVAMAEGIEVTQAPMSSRVLTYTTATSKDKR